MERIDEAIRSFEDVVREVHYRSILEYIKEQIDWVDENYGDESAPAVLAYDSLTDLYNLPINHWTVRIRLDQDELSRLMRTEHIEESELDYLWEHMNDVYEYLRSQIDETTEPHTLHIEDLRLDTRKIMEDAIRTALREYSLGDPLEILDSQH